MQFSNGGGQGCGTGHPYEINCGVQLDDSAIPPGRLSDEVSRAFKDMLQTCARQVGLFVSGGGGGGGGGVGANHSMRFHLGGGTSTTSTSAETTRGRASLERGRKGPALHAHTAAVDGQKLVGE